LKDKENMSNKEILNLLLLISPIFLIQIGLAVYALLDLSRRAKLRWPRWAWALGLIVTAFSIPIGIIVSGIYLAWGRHEA
jgi:heme/copper-type cytochrome/quinol oxidase subunit 2